MKQIGKLIEKQQKTLRQKINNSQSAAEFLTNYPAAGVMRDNISKKEINIVDCETSRLRRYVKLLNKYYNLVYTPDERKKIIDKLNEVNDELEKRPDAIIEHKK